MSDDSFTMQVRFDGAHHRRRTSQTVILGTCISVPRLASVLKWSPYRSLMVAFMSWLLWTVTGDKTRAEFPTPDTHGRTKTSGPDAGRNDARDEPARRGPAAVPAVAKERALKGLATPSSTDLMAGRRRPISTPAYDSRRLAEGLGSAGRQIELDQHPGLWHDSQLNAGLMPRAIEALQIMGAVPPMRLGMPLVSKSSLRFGLTPAISVYGGVGTRAMTNAFC